MPANMPCVVQGARVLIKVQSSPHSLDAALGLLGKTTKPRLPNCGKSATAAAAQPCDLKAESRAGGTPEGGQKELSAPGTRLDLSLATGPLWCFQRLWLLNHR